MQSAVVALSVMPRVFRLEVVDPQPIRHMEDPESACVAIEASDLCCSPSDPLGSGVRLAMPYLISAIFLFNFFVTFIALLSV